MSAGIAEVRGAHISTRPALRRERTAIPINLQRSGLWILDRHVVPAQKKRAPAVSRNYPVTGN